MLSAYEIRDLPPGLVVFSGPNEAGKSTLLAFLRGVLFGFPRAGKTRGGSYPPLSGGRHGGRVFIETTTGSVTVEREVNRPARITTHDGSQLTDSDFQRLVGGVDSQTFRTVFAFSLDELRDFDSLTGEQVRSRIFAAGLGGTGRSVRQVLQEFEKTTGQLLKTRSTEGEINSLLADLAREEHALEEARLRSEQYPDLLAEEQDLEVQLAGLTEEERFVRAEIARSERLMELWPTWLDLERDRAALGSGEAVDHFIAEPTQRLAEARAAATEAERSRARLREQLEHKTEQARGLRSETSDLLWAVARVVEEQAAQVPFYRDRLRERDAVVERARLEAEQLAAALGGLGGGATEAGLSGIDTSLPRMEEVREWRSRLTAAADRVKQGEERLETATLQVGRLERERDRQRDRLAEMPLPDEAALDMTVAAVRALRAGLTHLMAKQAALESHEKAYGTMKALLEGGGSEPAGARGRPGAPVASVVGVVLGVVLVVLAIVAGTAGWTLPLGQDARLALAVPLAVITVLAFLAAWLVWARARGHAPGREGREGEITELLRQESPEGQGLREAVESARRTVAQAAGRLGLAQDPDLEKPERAEALVEQADALVEEQKQAVAGWHSQEAKLREAEEAVKASALEQQEARQRLEQAEEGLRDLQREFAVLLEEWGLPRGLSGQAAEEYLRAVAAAKDIKHRLDGDRAALSRLEAEIEGWEAQATRLLGQAGVSLAPPGTRDLGGQLAELAALCSRESDRRRELAGLEEDIEELEAEMERADGEAREASAQLQALFDQVGAGDEEGFLERLGLFQERQELKRRIAEAQEHLRKRVGRGPEAESLLRELQEGDVSGWEERLRVLPERLEEIKRSRDEAVKTQGEIERRRRELESSADVPGLETVVAGLRTDLDEALQRWRVNTLAAHLVRTTLAKFTRERQPLVLTEASRMFALVTGGRYERVIQSTEDEGVVVVDAEGREKTPEQLSRGTVEQLYLCLRLGLAEEFSRRAEPIPLVMDDVLVNFDQARRRATADLLLEFAERQQILLFTCHPEIEELLLDRRPDTRVVSLLS